MFTQFFEPETAEKRNRRQGLDRPLFNSAPHDRLILAACIVGGLAVAVAVAFTVNAFDEDVVRSSLSHERGEQGGSPPVPSSDRLA